MAPTPTDAAKPLLRILLTGYGPFSRTTNNPSWLAVKDLNGTYIEPPPPYPASTSPSARPRPRIHITSFEIPVVYSDVLAVVPPLHFRPPQLPKLASNPGLPPPPDGYDFIVHVGLGSRGGLSLEKRGRKSGYPHVDQDGKLAPVISTDAPSAPVPQSEAVRREAEGQGSKPHAPGPPVRRGFAEGYEDFPEELWSTLDIDAIAKHVKSSGGEIYKKTKASDDAGLFLCEFINYAAMAESRRSAGKGKRTEVLFVHCPPDGQDLSVEQTTEGLLKIVRYVVWDLIGDGRK